VNLLEAVSSCLADDPGEAGIEASLQLMCNELGVDRISLHAVNESRASFRVIAGGGGPILAPGTELPLETSTQVAVPGRGGLFRRAPFDDGESFDRALDHLVVDMGYRAGCSIPLFVGSRPVGALCASSRDPDLDCDPILDAMTEVSSAMTLAFVSADDDSPRVLVCFDDALLAEGVARVVEHILPADVEICATWEDALREAERASAIDSIVCDVTFGGAPVDAFLASLRGAGASGPALVLASMDSPMSRSLAARGGATAYIARTDGPGGIATAMRTLAAGGGLRGDGWPGDDAEVATLTPQESRVLLGLERGLRFKQIAAGMGISESTAKGYARNLFAKLNAHSRGEAVHEARRQGLLDFLAGT
jgi:DNA-binding NarL/FixJ family response regulator